MLGRVLRAVHVLDLLAEWTGEGITFRVLDEVLVRHGGLRGLPLRLLVACTGVVVELRVSDILGDLIVRVVARQVLILILTLGKIVLLLVFPHGQRGRLVLEWHLGVLMHCVFPH